MKFRPINQSSCFAERRCGGFTLAEVLAALLFMAIVVPVAVEGLRLASRAGEVAIRKSVAARLAEQTLNELLVTGEWQRSGSGGEVRDGAIDYRWTLREEPWTIGNLRLVTVEVLYPVQGQEFDVRLSTVVDPSASVTDSTNTTTSASATGGAAR